jgi:hypothetical protein
MKVKIAFMLNLYIKKYKGTAMKSNQRARIEGAIFYVWGQTYKVHSRSFVKCIM